MTRNELLERFPAGIERILADLALSGARSGYYRAVSMPALSVLRSYRQAKRENWPTLEHRRQDCFDLLRRINEGAL